MKKTLRLQRSTVRALQSSDLKRAAGADFDTIDIVTGTIVTLPERFSRYTQLLLEECCGG